MRQSGPANDKITNDIKCIGAVGLNGKVERIFYLQAGEKAFLNVVFNPCDTGDPMAVTWKSSNKKAVTINQGMITAKDVASSDTSTISATVKYTDPNTGKKKNMTKV